jgi:hypothetical protein
MPSPNIASEKLLLELLHQLVLSVLATLFAILTERKSILASGLLLEGFVVFVVVGHVTKSFTDCALQSNSLAGTLFLFAWHMKFLSRQMNSVTEGYFITASGHQQPGYY